MPHEKPPDAAVDDVFDGRTYLIATAGSACVYIFQPYAELTRSSANKGYAKKLMATKLLSHNFVFWRLQMYSADENIHSCSALVEGIVIFV